MKSQCITQYAKLYRTQTFYIHYIITGYYLEIAFFFVITAHKVYDVCDVKKLNHTLQLQP